MAYSQRHWHPLAAIHSGVADIAPMLLKGLESRALAPHACVRALYSASALERTRTAMPFGTTPSRWRVYQFHHQGKTTACAAQFPATGPTGLEPATSRVTVECSNQTELRPQLLKSGSETLSSPRTCLDPGLVVKQSAAIAPRGIEPLSAP